MIQGGGDGGHTHVNIGAHLFWYISVYFSFLWYNFFFELGVTKNGMRRKEGGKKSSDRANMHKKIELLRKKNRLYPFL